MLFDLIRALLAGLLVGVVPGLPWAGLLVRAADRAERLAYAVALSLTLVPTATLVPARLLGLGVTLPVAALSTLFVFATGLAAVRYFGPAGTGPAKINPEGVARINGRTTSEDVVPNAPSPGALRKTALGLLVPALGLALIVALGWLPQGRVLPAVAVLLLCAAAAGLVGTRREEAAEESSMDHRDEGAPWTAALRDLALPAVLALALVRGYSGVVAHDWPFIRGVDQYSHAVMAERMMEVGTYEGYLIYPPGFHTMTAMVSRLSGLEPLEVFPVLAPALLVLPPLALYALGKRLWGWPVGVAAALLAALCVNGTYAFYNDAMYPNLVASQFLLVVSVAALAGLLAHPTVRSGLLLAILGCSVVLYHPLASLYLVLILAPVGLLAVPYLLLKDRRRGTALFLSMALLFVLAVLQAWDTYDLPRAVAGLLPGGPENGSTTGTAVDGAIGTQEPYELAHLLENVSPPVAVLGLVGAFLLLRGVLSGVFRGPYSWHAPRVIPGVVLLWWSAFLLAGSRTTLSGFPQRFERDLSIPLALLAGLALVAALRPLGAALRERADTTRARRGPLAASLALVVAVLGGGLIWHSANQNFVVAAGPTLRVVVDEEIAEAGEWLREHNEGGNIMVGPDINQVPSRIMLAYGGYTALQSFERAQIAQARDLPPHGPEPLLDVLYVLENPGEERTQRLIEEHDVEYIVTYKRMPDREFTPYYEGFEERPDLYRKVFENGSVIIFEPREA